MDGQAFQTVPSSPPPLPQHLHHHQTQVINDYGYHDCVNSNDNLEQLMNLINGGNAEQPNSNLNPNYVDSESEELEDSSESLTEAREKTGDRARTVVSERRKWRSMKEKLLALRALVPNISKMDKASMVEDAVLYVQNLQMQIKKLRTEVAGLELSLGGSEKIEKLSSPKPRKVQVVDKKHHGYRILQMDVHQVGEREFYVRSSCNRGEGVAVALYRAVESLTSFDVQSSNVTAVSERFVLTFTLTVRKAGEEMNVSALKKLVTGALLNQGFELKSQGDP